MNVRALRGTLLVQMETRFDERQAERLREAAEAFGPLSRLIVDFTRVHDLDDGELAELGRTMSAMRDVEIVLRGLTMAQFRQLDEPLVGTVTVPNDSHPRPTALTAPINPDRSMENYRALFCQHYDSCLDAAVSMGWGSWSCVRCPLFMGNHTAHESEGCPTGHSQ